MSRIPSLTSSTVWGLGVGSAKPLGVASASYARCYHRRLMAGRILTRIGIAIAVMACWTPGTAEGQQPARRTPAAAQPAAAPRPWTPSKTPWGEPDLRGTWPLNHL